MTEESKILVVDDEPSISMLLDFNLRMAGFHVRCIHDGESVFEALTDFRPDLIVLDLMLPKMDGLQVCRKLRGQNNYVPVIMLTALQDISDKIAGLDMGADDYMTKPFSPHELVSRISAILRRTRLAPSAAEHAAIELGNLRIWPDQREVTLEDEPIDLTPKEFELLMFLLKHHGKVLSRQQLLHGVWDYHFLGDTRIVDVHVSHLRDKIETNPRDPKWIKTVRNVGYKLSDHAIKRTLA
jgi:two-component system alkaline phosphatase synthesis response regulator PhoP